MAPVEINGEQVEHRSAMPFQSGDEWSSGHTYIRISPLTCVCVDGKTNVLPCLIVTLVARRSAAWRVIDEDDVRSSIFHVRQECDKRNDEIE